MSARAKPAYKQIVDFCTYHLGKGCFAPHTGYDWSAWVAFVYLCEAYARGDHAGRPAAIAAMREILAGVQNDEQIHQTFAQAIAGVLDWSDVPRIWPQLQSNWHVRAVDRPPTEAERAKHRRGT